MLEKVPTPHFNHRRSVLFTHLADVMCSEGVNKHPSDGKIVGGGGTEERFETKGEERIVSAAA